MVGGGSSTTITGSFTVGWGSGIGTGTGAGLLGNAEGSEYGTG